MMPKTRMDLKEQVSVQQRIEEGGNFTNAGSTKTNETIVCTGLIRNFLPQAQGGRAFDRKLQNAKKMKKQRQQELIEKAASKLERVREEKRSAIASDSPGILEWQFNFMCWSYVVLIK